MLKDEQVTEETRALARSKGCDLISFVGPSLVANQGILTEFKWTDGITQSLLARWLREVHGIHIENVYAIGTKYIDQYTEYWYRIVDSNGRTQCATKYYLTFELAMEAGLQEALKLLPDVNA